MVGPLVTLTLCLAMTVGLAVGTAGVASGDPQGGSGDTGGSGGTAYPSQDEVERAKARAVRTAHDVGAIKGRLLLANQSLDQANLRAEQASEAYNGAMWRLEQAKAAYRQARQDVAQAQASVAEQRNRIGALVAQSYQNGGDLTALNAMMSADGLEGVMDQLAAFQGASTSMQADYKRFAATDALAQVFESKARRAKVEQVRLAARAEQAKQQAVASVDAAQAEAARIDAEKERLISALADAQDISVGLARKRQAALEQLARQRAQERARQAAIAAAKAAAAAEAKARAEAAAAQKAADEAAAAAKKKADDEAATAAAKKKAADDEAAAAAAAATKREREKASAAQPSESAPKTSGGGGSGGDGGGGDNGGGASDPTPTPPPPTPPAPPAPPTPPAPPAPSGGVDAAIAYAKAQLGEPYRWGATGPTSWDCSGLTMRAWQAAGRSLPHYSVAQYDAGTPIPISDARPGDLLFWSSNGRPSGIHHVALSLGGSSFIEAPRTGLDVRLNSIYTWYPDFAVRL